MLGATVLVAVCCIHADEQQIQKALEQQFAGKLLTLRGFYKGDFLKYDASGQPDFRPDPGPWTLYGKIAITGIKLEEDKVKLVGNRVFIAWPEDSERVGRMSQMRSSPITIEVKRDATHQDEKSIEELLAKVFLSANDNISQLVPEHWRDFLSAEDIQIVARRPNRRPRAPRAASQNQPTETKSRLTRIRVSQGITEGLLVKKVQPQYPPLAKSVKLQGEVSFNVVIDREGVLKEICVIKPLGLGMEESAMEAISQWRYRTYLLEGEPVEVETVITVLYTMNR